MGSVGVGLDNYNNVSFVVVFDDDRVVGTNEAVEIARMRLQGLDQFVYDCQCCCFSSSLAHPSIPSGHALPQEVNNEFFSTPSPLNDSRFLHVGVEAYHKVLSAKWFPILSLNTNEIDLHVSTAAAFNNISKHSNIYIYIYIYICL